jgi:predicted choloylglycine hydrolase
VFAKFAPALWEELAGLADELGIAMERAAYWFGNDGLRPPIGACSAVMTAGVYGRNFDFRPRYYGARFILLQASGSYASIGSSHQLTGRLDRMNEHGLMIGLHRVKKSPRFSGLSADLIVRMILDQCSTTKEALTPCNIIIRFSMPPVLLRSSKPVREPSQCAQVLGLRAPIIFNPLCSDR